MNRKVLQHVCEVVGVEFGRRCRILLLVLYVMDDDIEVVIHRGRKFVNDGFLKYEVESDTMYFDPDLWSYFVVVTVVKGVMHIVTLARLNGQVHLYVVHTVSQPNVIHMIEYNVDEGGDEVAPEVHEGGEGAQFGQAIDDGVTQQLDEGVGVDGERVEVVVGQAEIIEAYDVEGDRKEVDEGDGERTKADQVEVERIQVDEGDGDKTEADEVEGKISRKWNIAISKNMAYKAKAYASHEVEGSFIIQYNRI
ncbi:hypothetical protein LR48_Vigan04g072700 [Vigna angularis]|uniref:Uncharacterized protein n=1 Tax=Phaseolus angularis TaxID=3914 RepID=A0A0L9UDD3_PHAAN|nr:hypothetical protein LR48_Vigan04g072700 [Vigna angularis]